MNVEHAQASRDNIYRKHNLGNKMIILSVNRLSAEKHVEVLIRAAPAVLKQFPEAHFVIIGPDFGQQPFLMQEINRLNLHEHCTFLGTLDKDDVFSAYQHGEYVFPGNE